MVFDLKEYKDKTVHFIGIGGVSMSGLAAILLDNKVKVTGSDFKKSANTNKLESFGAKIYYEQKKENITNPDIVVYTVAVDKSNDELKEALKKGIPTYTRAEFLGHILNNFNNSIAVSGTHGKTSTTSMLSSIALSGKLDPTILVGANLPLIDGNYRIGKGELFITEACEYKESFLKFPGKVSILLNFEEDHLDYYRDLKHILDTFRKYITLLPKDGTIVCNSDDPNMQYVIEDSEQKKITFGIKKGMIKAKNIKYNKLGNSSFDVYKNEDFLMHIKLNVPGEFNIYNALASIGASIASGIDKKTIEKGLNSYQGVDKRFQYLFEKNNIKVFDDYAHHPKEIEASIKAAKNIKHNNIHIVFQPHTFSRTKALFHDFAASFDNIKSLVLLDIFPAREIDRGIVSSEDLAKEIKKRNTLDVYKASSFENAADILKKVSKPSDIIITMGAGESVKVAEILKEIL
ncbi:MAG: UDP-N-acetylmuramate--L-alanine ligase [Clostridium sp.]|nr:UDP-N-acetylmuramate--L-alanine ligase [Clostridium sp.]